MGPKYIIFKKIFGYVLVISVCGIVTFLPNIFTSAQTIFKWEPQQRIYGYNDEAFPPILVADQNKTVHAFISQWVGDQNRQKAIVYRRWSIDNGWTIPVDIIFSPKFEAEIMSACLDHTGLLHIVFYGNDGTGGSIYYSKALAIYADDANAWSEPVIVGFTAIGPGSAVIAYEGGNLVVIYSGNASGIGIYSSTSTNQGDEWTEPERIYLSEDELLPLFLNADLDEQNQLHLVWNMVDVTGNIYSIYNALYNFTRDVWSSPRMIVESGVARGLGVAFPRIAVSGDEMIIVYNHKTDASSAQQWFLKSIDGGNTWSTPTRPFPEYVGRSGFHSVVVDSSGAVHMLFVQRRETFVDGAYITSGGLMHSEYKGDTWSTPDQISRTSTPDGQVADQNSVNVINSWHDPNAVVSQGNVILVTWRADPGVGQYGVWYSFTILDSQELPVQPLSTPIEVDELDADIVLPTLESFPTALTPTSALVKAELINQPKSIEVITPGSLIYLALLPVVLLIAGVIIWQRYSNHR